MPGAGKSYIGKKLAQNINYDFFDFDDYIEATEGRKLQEILDELGDEGFLEIEEKRVLEKLPMYRAVLSPGGSVVYNSKLMEEFRKCSKIVYLSQSLQTIISRLPKQRGGIVGLKNKGIEQLFEERIILYEKYADYTVDCEDLELDEIIQKILEII
ncbi:MAG: shikimate kinase [Candidatus Dojkabacteria bacterium]|nr:shikimate kinase [Candidatus Dojkabacteria bacterium]